MAEGHESQSSTLSSDQDSADKKTQVPTVGGLKSQNGNVPMFPIMFPALVPGLFPPQLNQEQMNCGPGLYAVPILPFMQPIIGFPSNTLIPFTYNIPTERRLPETREMGGEQVQGVEQQQQEAGPQRQVVVRRFQIAIHIDVLLILKLAAVIFLFNQDGSRQRLALLVCLASLVYLYQTGALAPVIRWLSQGMRRAAAPPQPPRAGVQADNIPAGAAHGNENAGMAVALGKLQTCDILQRRQPHHVLRPQWCILCKKNEEDQDHLLLHCSFTRQIWIKVMQHMGFEWVFPKFSRNMLVMENVIFKNREKQLFWYIIVHGVFWSIWTERNHRIFSDKEESTDRLWEKIKFIVAT